MTDIESRIQAEAEKHETARRARLNGCSCCPYDGDFCEVCSPEECDMHETFKAGAHMAYGMAIEDAVKHLMAEVRSNRNFAETHEGLSPADVNDSLNRALELEQQARDIRALKEIK